MYKAWHKLQDNVIESAPPYPAGRFSGRGIVICAGGARLFTCAWVLLRVLRGLLGSTLPVQVWHLGLEEMDSRMSELLQSLGAQVVDATRIGRPREQPGHRWAVKPFALLHCPFREVVLIDADNVPLADPSGLFETPPYRETGAVFWPDLEPLGPEQAIWEICRVPYREEPSFESGQIVIDKARCWKPLLLTMHLNEHHAFYYQHLNGDKDTFHMAWRMLDQPYSMPPHPVRLMQGEQDGWFGYLGPVLGQHDFAGNLLFQHRNWPKWILFGANAHYPEFRYEQECLEFLRELARRWDGTVSTFRVQPPDGYQNNASGARWFRYVRVSSDERMLEFLPDGRIGQGAGRSEQRWELVSGGGRRVLEIWGDGPLTCRLAKHADGVWRGNWMWFERLPVELIPLEPPRAIRWRWFWRHL